jgi:F-type H+-transporting ATPase subunit a
VPQQLHKIQIAQAEGPAAPRTGEAEGQAAGTHAEQGHHEHHYKLGDIPDPHVLFWHSLLVALVLILFGWRARARLQKIPGSMQNFGEFVTEAMVNFTRGIIGPGGEKYVPLVGTVFFFILVGNLFGQIPYLMSPTANLSTTLALGFIVFLYVQYLGIRANGIGGYVKHFMGPMPFVAPLLFPIELISEIVKPFTLAMRLFGNIFGEDTVIIVISALSVAILPKAPILPLQFPILVLGLLTAFVQALVFSLLTCIYISLQSHHDSEHEGHGHSPGHGHPGIEESGLVP